MKRISYEEFKNRNLQVAWKSLVRNASFQDIGQTYDWNRRWYDFHFSNESNLWLLTHEVDNKIIAIIPLVCRKLAGLKVLSLLGTNGIISTDYTDLICIEGYRGAVFNALLNFLYSDTQSWDVLDLKIPGGQCALSSYLKSLITFRDNNSLSFSTLIDGYAAVITLPRTLEEYRINLGKKTRSDFNKILRVLNNGDFSFQLSYGETAIEDLMDLYELNKLNWDYFSDANIRDFYRDVVTEISADGNEIFVAKLLHRRHACAVVLGYQNGKQVFLHPAGVKRVVLSGISPGTALYVSLIQSCIANGIGEIDLSPGLEAYKARLCSHVRPLYKLVIASQRRNYIFYRLIVTGRKVTRFLHK